MHLTNRAEASTKLGGHGALIRKTAPNHRKLRILLPKQCWSLPPLEPLGEANAEASKPKTDPTPCAHTVAPHHRSCLCAVCCHKVQVHPGYSLNVHWANSQSRDPLIRLDQSHSFNHRKLHRHLIQGPHFNLLSASKIWKDPDPAFSFI